MKEAELDSLLPLFSNLHSSTGVSTLSVRRQGGEFENEWLGEEDEMRTVLQVA